MALSPRRTVGTLLSSLLAMTFIVAGASASQAEDGYRYWNYSHLNGDTFEFAQTGPGDFTPKEGDVEGWRFGTSTVSTGIEPRADLAEVSFEAICGDEEAAAGEKRVALLVDYGTEADADGAEVPAAEGLCAVVPTGANAQQTLESVVDVRADDSLICALDGYPVSGCGAPVPNATVEADEADVAFELPAEAADESSDDSGTPWGLIGVGAAVVVIAGVAVPLYRRNRVV